VEEFFDWWMPTRDVAETTAERDVRQFKLYFGPLLSTRLSELHYTQIDRWMADMRRRGLSPNSIRLVRALLRRGLQEAMKAGWVQRNEAALSHAPRVPAPDPDYLSAPESKALLAAAGTDRLAPFIWLCLFCGLRRGEALGLEWQDVDLVSHTLTVRRSLYRHVFQPGEVSLQAKEPKSKQSRRLIPLATPLAVFLTEHWERQVRQAQVDDRPLPTPVSPVVATSLGSWVDPDNASAYLRQVGERAGIVVSSHKLRRTCATLLLDLDFDVSVVANVLGHSSVAVTLKHYGFIMDRGKRAALDGLGAALVPDSAPHVAATVAYGLHVADPSEAPAGAVYGASSLLNASAPRGTRTTQPAD
jgi:integrase